MYVIRKHTCNISCLAFNYRGVIMIDIKVLGAESYPDAPEDDIKEFEIETEISAKMKIVIYAKNEEEAKEFAEQGKLCLVKSFLKYFSTSSSSQ